MLYVNEALARYHHFNNDELAISEIDRHTPSVIEIENLDLQKAT